MHAHHKRSPVKVTVSSSTTAGAAMTANKSTPNASFHKTPTTQPATTKRDNDSWLAEIRAAMQQAGIALCLHNYKEARKKYCHCVQMLLDCNTMSAPTSVRSERTTVRQEQQAQSCFKIGSDLIPAVEGTDNMLSTEQYYEVEEKYYHSLQLISERISPPIHGHLGNEMSRLYLFMPLLCYACGVACVKSAAVLQDLQAAIQFFNSIHNGDDLSSWFPLACYGLGNAALSQYRYKDARKNFKRGLRALSAPVSSFLASLYWPGTCTPVDEIHDAEKAFLKAITCTLYPAPPDGRCVYSFCLSNGNEQRSIYTSSLGFKGCTTLTCIDGCRIMYHSECWKSFKLQKWMKLTEKEILGQRCFTPECEGTLFSITSILIKNGKQILSEIFVPPAARRKPKSSGDLYQVASGTGGRSTGRPQARLRQISPALPPVVHTIHVAAMPGATEMPAEVVALGVTEMPEEAASPLKEVEATNVLMSDDTLKWQKPHARTSINEVAGEHKEAKPLISHAENGEALKELQCRSVDLTSPTVVSDSSRNDHQLICSIQQAVIEGGSALIGQNYSAAETQYETCLKLMALLVPVPKTIYDSVSKQAMEMRLLYCAAGFACLQQNTKQGVMKGIDHFGAIVNTSGSVWPIAYYGRGQGFMQIGSYRHATSDFTKGLTMLSKNFERTLYWPGTTVNIPESCDLKDKFEMALFASRYPPMPVARCVFEHCPTSNFSEREIYDGSLQYEGYVSIICSNKCIMNYHKDCWKGATLLFWGKPTDKGVPGQPCVTPNCNGKLTRVTVRKHIDGKDQTREKIYHTSITAKNQERNTVFVASNHQPRVLAAASLPLTFNLLTKAITQQRQCHDDGQGGLLESVTVKGDATRSSPEEREKPFAARSKGKPFLAEKVATSSQASDSAFSVGDVPLLIIKKEPDRQENNLQPATKSNSKVRSVTNGVLRPHIIARAFENSDEQTAQGELKNMWNYAHDANTEAAESARENSSCCNPSIVHIEALTAQVPPKEICEKIVRFFEEYLKKNSPLDVQDIAITEFLVSKFPPQALDIVSACGGICDFLTQYEQFSLIENYLCLRTKPDSAVHSATTSDIVPVAVQANYAVLNGNHSPQQELTMTPEPNIAQRRPAPEDVRKSILEDQDIITSSKETVTPASSTILSTMLPHVSGLSNESNTFAAIISENDIAVNPILLTNLHETASDDHSGTDTCGSSHQSEVLMSLSARDDSVETDIPKYAHGEATFDENIALLDSKQQAMVQLDGRREECIILEQILAEKLTETKELTDKRDSLVEQLKCQHSQMMSQIQSLQHQVSQLTGEVAQAKREAELDRAALNNLGSCIMQLLRVNIGYQEQELEQRKLTSAQLKEIESGVAKVFSKVSLSQDDDHPAVSSSIICKD